MMDEDDPEQLKAFGAVGWPIAVDHISLWGLRLKTCQNFDHEANVRPVQSCPASPAPCARPTTPNSAGWAVRENSEGENAGLGGRNLSARGKGGEVAVRSALFTEVGCERIMASPSTWFGPQPPQGLLGDRGNAQQYGMVLWDDVCKRVALDYSDVKIESVLVDAMSAKFVLKPEDLSVVVSNLNADILSDLSAALWPAASASPQAPASSPSAASRACSSRRPRTGHRQPGPGQPDRQRGADAEIGENVSVELGGGRCSGALANNVDQDAPRRRPLRSVVPETMPYC
ncbi:isocitrate/isopropylmalate family dehydrogenase [Streptomyces sp. L7]